jgi:sodium/bile acid cotransporter 7
MTSPKRRVFKLDPFMIGMVIAVALAAAAPAIGSDDGPLRLGLVTDIGVALVFFLHGAKLSTHAVRAGLANWRLQLLVHASTFILFPLLGAAIFFGLDGVLTPELALGIFFLCAVCSTISTSVAMTAMAGGNVAAAVMAATASGLIGMALTPILMGLVSATSGVHLPIGPAIRGVIIQLLIPFALGHALAFAVRPILERFKPVVTWIDRGVILLIVYAAFSNLFAEGLWRQQPPLALAVLVLVLVALLGIALTFTTFAARAAGFSREDEIAIVFCGSKKSLANGAPIARILFDGSPALGVIMLPLILYHQLQLVVCAAIARRYAARGAGDAAA